MHYVISVLCSFHHCVVYTFFSWSHQWIYMFSVPTDWLILKIISQYDVKHITMLQIKNNNVNVFVYIITVHPICLTIIHYHSSSYLSHYHTNDNVCLNLLICCYFIYIVAHGFNDRLNTSTQRKSPNSKWLITSCCIEYAFYCDQPRLYK
jgi:hypothetical protein